jgi:uroporphyrinogen-III decarboxylase
LAYGTPTDVRREVLEALRVGAVGGRYVLSTDHSLHGGLPLPNIMAMIETVQRCGSYPLSLPDA